MYITYYCKIKFPKGGMVFPVKSAECYVFREQTKFEDQYFIVKVEIWKGYI